MDDLILGRFVLSSLQPILFLNCGLLVIPTCVCITFGQEDVDVQQPLELFDINLTLLFPIKLSATLLLS